MAYAVWSPTQDQQNQWTSQRLNPLATSPRAGTTGTTGWGYQQTNAPGWTGNADAWNTSKNGAPVSMFGGTIGGSQLGDVYSTQPVGPNGYPTTSDEIPRQPVPARPSTPTTPPTWVPGDRTVQPQFGIGDWNAPTLDIPAAQRPGGGYAYPIGPMTPGGMLPQGVPGANGTLIPTAEWLSDPTNQYALNTWLPWAQMDFDRYMAGQNFNQAAYQDDRNYGRQVALDQYNTALQSRQQQAAEWQAAEAARQWAEQFGYTQQRDAQEFQLANDQLAVERAYRQGLITNEQRNLALQELTQRQNNELGQGQLQLSRDELAALQQWRQTDAGLRQQELDNNLMAARYAAFGRSQAPSFGKFYRNW